MTVPLRVAVMGCVVNGPGEAREADLGVASGNGLGRGRFMEEARNCRGTNGGERFTAIWWWQMRRQKI